MDTSTDEMEWLASRQLIRFFVRWILSASFGVLPNSIVSRFHGFFSLGSESRKKKMLRVSLVWRGNSTSNLRTRTWILPDLRKKDATVLPLHKTGQLNTREAFSKNPGAAEYEQYTGTTGSTWKHTTRSNSFPGSGDRGRPFVDKRNHYENREKFSQFVKTVGAKGRNPYSD